MKRIIYISLISFNLIAFSSTWSWEGSITKIVDGDTLKVVTEGKIIKIRLYGIDTPEKTQKSGPAATDFVRGFLPVGTKVSVLVLDEGIYDRPIAVVSRFIDGESLNKALVKVGFAWVYTLYCRASFCQDWKALEAQARQQKIGLWAHPDPVPPWTYRKRMKSKF